MGLPIWRDPEEKKSSKDAIKTDPTAAARSAIRRRPSIHGRRSFRPRLTRDATVHLPRVQPPLPPTSDFVPLRDFRRDAMGSGVPPIATLLESADRQGNAPPPPPVPESRNYYTHNATGSARDRPSTRDLATLQETANRLERHTAVMRERLLQSRMESGWRRDRTSTAESRRSRDSRELPPPTPLPDSVRRDIARSRHPPPARRVNLPTPPLDTSDTEGDSLLVPEVQSRSGRGDHPLRNSWSPDSPVDGLGDRNRSPTPADGWEIMRSTITPDATLPSADSSFTSAAASQSFSSARDTTVTEPESASSSSNSRRNSSDDGHSDSASSVDSRDLVDPAELVCDDEHEHIAGAEGMAEYMHDYEMGTPGGRVRIADLQRLRDRDGNRFALAHETARIDIGFRLIEDALETEDGRDRLIQVGVLAHSDDADELLGLGEPEEPRRPRYGQITHPRRTDAHITDEEPPPPNPARYGDEAGTAARQASAQVHDYIHRHTADAMQARTQARPRSPPPRYEPLGSHPDVETFTSRDEPQPHPVSPPTQRSQTEVTDALLSGSEADLGAMRRVVERLARRDDVPEEWWSSIGLNLSRSRSRALSPLRNERPTETAAGDRVRSGRIERRNSRL